jgi:MoxR-like ATPase
VLPESQLDLFLIRTSVGYPAAESERRVLEDHRKGEPVDSIKSVVNVDEILSAQAAVRGVRVDETLRDYLLQIVAATRASDVFRLGVSTRAALSFYRGCQARAVCQQRDFVTPDDIKSLAVPTLSHRVLVDDFSRGSDRSATEAVVADLVQQIPVPV